MLAWLGSPIRLEIAELYNPSGDGTYGPGSPFGAGERKPTALVISIAGVWCGPCREEAATVLPQKYAALQSRGLEILSLLADGATPVGAGGDPATIEELNTWIQTFDSTYPSVIDPTYYFAAPFGTMLPGNFVIDTRTMMIVQRISAAPE